MVCKTCPKHLQKLKISKEGWLFYHEGDKRASKIIDICNQKIHELGSLTDLKTIRPKEEAHYRCVNMNKIFNDNEIHELLDILP